MQFGFIWVHWFIAEIERIYGIKNGNNQHTERVETKFPPKTQSDLAYDRGVLALKLKPVIAEKAKERMLAGKSDPNQKSDEGMTSKALGKIAGISHDTIPKYITEHMYGRKFGHHSFIENHGLFKRYEYYGWQRTGIYRCQ